MLYIKKIVELVEKEGIDIICTYYAFESSFLAIKAAKFCNKPIVIETFAETIFMKDKPEDTNKAEIYVPLFKYIFNNVNCVIAPSQHCLNGAKQYIKRQKILAKVIISGIDLDRLLINVDKEEQKK
ncbi:MAG: glycosyltransferase family 4 protein, partial [Candidatus Njordarchaeales archaeon]